MHGTTRGVDLFETLTLSMKKKIELTFEKLSGLTTDGAPAMVGLQKGLIVFVKKELNHLSLDPSDLIICHCIIYQESLCAQLLRFNNVMAIVASCIGFSKSRGFNSYQFKKLQSDLYSGAVILFITEVQWLSCGNKLMSFNELRMKSNSSPR